MEMRKSLIKFGSSFGSSFHLSKDEKIERKKLEREKSKEMDLEFIMEEKKEEFSSSKKSYGMNNHDLISKKFDEMEEILMELQKKDDRK